MADTIKVGTVTLTKDTPEKGFLAEYGSTKGGNIFAVMQRADTGKWHSLYWPGHQDGKPMPKDYHRHAFPTRNQAVADLKKRARL